MLTLKELDNIINDDYYHNALYEGMGECHCGSGIVTNLYVYSFGYNATGVYRECVKCAEQSYLELRNTTIRPITEQELFYLRCHVNN